MADVGPHYPYPSSSAQQLDRQLAGGAVAAAVAAAAAAAANDQHHEHSLNKDLSPIQTAASRKRHADGTSSSSRGVANLTPEQLQKKRRNDREAQRAIRERTRGKIEFLEARIKVLEAQQPYQELQAVIRARDAVQAENEELKRRLNNISALTRSLDTANGLDGLALATSRQDPLPTAQPPPLQSAVTDHQRPPQQDFDPSEPAQRHLHPELREHEDDGAAEVALMDPSRQSVGIRSNHEGFETNPHAHPSLHIKPTHPLDVVLDEFLTTVRQPASRSKSEIAMLEVSRAPPLDVLDPTCEVTFDALTTATKAITATLPELWAYTEKAAYFYSVYFLLRWTADPTVKTYDQIPVFLRPTQLQTEQPHAAWIDFVPWPGMRDFLIMTQTNYTCETVFRAITRGLSVTWANESAMSQITTYPYAGTKSQFSTLGSEFEDHVREIDNWTLDQAVATELPNLVQACRVNIV